MWNKPFCGRIEAFRTGGGVGDGLGAEFTTRLRITNNWATPLSKYMLADDKVHHGGEQKPRKRFRENAIRNLVGFLRSAVCRLVSETEIRELWWASVVGEAMADGASGGELDLRLGSGGRHFDRPNEAYSVNRLLRRHRCGEFWREAFFLAFPFAIGVGQKCVWFVDIFQDSFFNDFIFFRVRLKCMFVVRKWRNLKISKNVLIPWTIIYSNVLLLPWQLVSFGDSWSFSNIDVLSACDHPPICGRAIQYSC